MLQTPFAENWGGKVLWFFNYYKEVKWKKDIIILRAKYCVTRVGLLWFIVLFFCFLSQPKIEIPLLFCEFPLFIKKLLVWFLMSLEATKCYSTALRVTWHYSLHPNLFQALPNCTRQQMVTGKHKLFFRLFSHPCSWV